MATVGLNFIKTAAQKACQAAAATVTGKATVTNLIRRNPRNGIVEISMEVRNQQGEVVLTNVTEAIVKCRPL